LAKNLHIKASQQSVLNKQITCFTSDIQIGCAANTHKVLKLGFDTGANFVIHLEDDTIPSRDYLRYMEFAEKSFRDNPEIFVIVGWNRRLEANLPEEYNLIGKRKSPVTFQAWGTWKYIWDEIKDEWFGISWKPDYKHPDNAQLVPEGEEFMRLIIKNPFGSWGYPMLKYFSKGRLEVFPYISRCQNIGDVKGCFNSSPQWHKENIWTPIWANQIEPPEKYIISQGL
jgi:hypothetical protein